ncbi:unnamed protein product [Ilex paraguariensis]|uniref:Pectinesterase n=1 Tax=Ilex paraguariensis TaxID=185542 RepID=A0ABC8RE72_9AQUA
MRIIDWIVCWLIGFAASGTTTSWAAKDPFEEYYVRTQCGYTRFPSLCVDTLKGLGLGSGHGHQHVDLLSALVNKTMFETKQMPISNFAKLSYHFISLEAQHVRMATGYCHKVMKMSLKRLTQALEALKESPRKNKQDIQTWISAVLTFQQACKDSADAQAHSNVFMSRISEKMTHLSQLSSNLLAFVNRITGGTPKNNSNSRYPDGKQVFTSWVSTGADRKLLQATTIKANAIVAKDGSGNYKTISEALQGASGGARFVIYVKSGVYNEKIHINKDGITLIGDGKYSTIISGDDSVAGGASLQSSATVAITGDGFIARDIGFQNTAGPQGEQAVALIVASDHSVLYRCSIVGYQDTLYAHTLRQFYRECDIYGTVDFIFGNAAAVFQNCNLVLRKPHTSSAYNVILANGRSGPGQNTGFSIQNCKITTATDFSPVKHSYNSYLGRPWKEYSRSVVMQSTIDEAIAPRGWVEWPGSGSSILGTLYFAEYSNVGVGAATAKRVQWSGFHVIGKEEAIKYSVGSFIAGTSWLPSTGVTFISGLE